jgi:hypothetical protein
MLRIKHGSVFDEKCDLMILPINSAGGVTDWVLREVRENMLELPRSSIPFGKVMFIETNSKYMKADYVGYAASVDAKTTSSNIRSIEKIAKEIINFCKEKDCTSVNIPPLGTGAGNLPIKDVVDLFTKTFSNNNINFTLFLPDKNIASVFSTQHENSQVETKSDIAHPRVFISYSWKDDNSRQWTHSLARKLRENGVDARLDKFHLKPGMDMPQWMTNELIKAEKVLLICDHSYAEKADMRKAGVGWETMIIQGDMMAQGENNTKYIAISCGEFDKSIPIYMKTKLAFSKEDIDQSLELLLENIFDLDGAPEIGEIPNWVAERKARQPKNP